MADMPTDFWAGWIAVLTIVSLLGLAWLVFSIYFIANKQEQNESPVWDHTLTEDNNPAPMWWFWMTLGALVITVVYLILYPGLGSFSGTLKWSQHGRLDHSLGRYNEKFSPIRKYILQRPIAEIKKNQAIMESAQRVFVQNCAVCHGVDGKGQALAFPNLKDDDWQWGDTENQIADSIMQGRRAVMVGWQNVIGDKGVEQVKNYVKTLASKTKLTSYKEGKEIFNKNCAACHGLLGEGNAALGAPNLADNIWLYGSSDEAITQSIAYGRSGMMPSFSSRLDKTQIRMLTALLLPERESTLVTNQIEHVVKNEAEQTLTQETALETDNYLGDKVYKQYCASCHQVNGMGVPGVFPPLINNETVLNNDPGQHIDVVLNGIKDKVIAGVAYPTPMPGFAAQLNDEEIAAVVNHERTKWGNQAVQIKIIDVSARR